MRLPLTIMIVGLVGATFAGCIGSDGDELVPNVQLPELTTVVELTHELEEGHTMADLHDVASPNMVLKGYTNLSSEGTPLVTGNAEVVVHETYAYVATLGAASGFAIVDISDPEDLKVVGQYRNPDVYSPDVKVTWDGKYALLSSHPGTTLASIVPEAGAVPSRVTNPLSYLENEDHVTGVTLVDITDKSDPKKVAEYIAEPNGVHNTEYAKIGGRDIVFSVDRNNVAVLEIQETPTGTELVPIAEVFADKDYRETLGDKVGSTNANSYLPPGSHDVVYEQHPLTQDHLIYIPFGTAGFFIYNVNDPANPSMMSHWKGLPPGNGYYHYAAPVPTLIDDRHVTAVAPELFNNAETTGTIQLLDTTNPRQPQELGTWELPGEDLFIEKNYRFSPHNWDFDDEGRMFLANYHAGVWVIDLACEDCVYEPQVDGFYLPHEDPQRLDEDGEVVCAFWCERPFVWGVVQGDDGILYASDIESGLYAVEYTPLDAEGDAEA